MPSIKINAGFIMAAAIAGAGAIEVLDIYQRDPTIHNVSNDAAVCVRDQSNSSLYYIQTPEDSLIESFSLSYDYEGKVSASRANGLNQKVDIDRQAKTCTLHAGLNTLYVYEMK